MNKKIKILNFFVLIAVTFFSLCSSYSAEAENNENNKRNWRNSLNVYNNNEIIPINVDQWLENTFLTINESNEINIRGKFQKQPSPEQNIAASRFTIIYKLNEEVKYKPFDLMKIFVSGLNSLDLTNKEVIEKNLHNNIIFPISFINGIRPSGPDINAIQKNKINNILGREVVQSGTHSEGSICLYIYNNLRNFIESISKDNFVIMGTILEISSFKDPCSETCMPMLKALMENFHTILSSHAKENVTICNKLENLMLLSGRKKHISSRDGMEVKNEIIKLNFDAPSNRFYSMKKD